MIVPARSMKVRPGLHDPVHNAREQGDQQAAPMNSAKYIP